jgi:hypothetical protein
MGAFVRGKGSGVSEKLKNSDEVTFTIPQQLAFYGLWILLGIIGTAILTGVAVAALVTYGRDAVYAIAAGNLGNLILNLIAFALSIGLAILAWIAGLAGLYMPFELFSTDAHVKTMQQFRRDVIKRRFKSSDDTEASQ